jgi:hypothetical protein
MARILRIELRRSVAWWAALIIAAVGVFVLFASNPPYPSWMELVITQRDVMQLTWPLALAAGAWQGIRERRSRVEELLATTAKPRRWRVVPVASAMAIGAVAGYVVMLAGATGHLRHIDGYFPAAALPIIALGSAAMVAAVWLGLAIGAMLPSPLTAPVLVVVGFIGMAVVGPMLRVRDVSDPGAVLLLPYLRTPHEDNPALQMLSTGANLSQALWFATLAATGLALYSAARPSTRIAAVAPALLGVTLAVPAMPRYVEDAWVIDRRAAAVVCTPDEPRVCLARVHSHRLDDLRGPAREALSILAAKLPPAPTRVLVTGFGEGGSGPQPADTLVVAPGLLEGTEYTRADLVAYMLGGGGAQQCQVLADTDPNEPVLGEPGEADNRYAAARQVVTDWLLDRTPTPPPVAGAKGSFFGLVDQTLADLRALPVDEQRARVNAFREAERTCADGDRLDLLTGGSR